MSSQANVHFPSQLQTPTSSPKVFQVGNILFDDINIDVTGLAPRKEREELACHYRKQFLVPKITEPNWDNVEESKAWLEEHFTGSAALGSPLLRKRNLDSFFPNSYLLSKALNMLLEQ